MNERKGIVLVLLTAVISGVSVYVNSIAVKFSNPFILTGVKNLLVGIVVFSLLLLAREWRSLKDLTRQQWYRLMAIALVGGSVPFLLFFKGLTLTSAARGGFTHKTMFLYVGLLAIFFLKERLNKSLLVGIAALLVGNIMFLGITPQHLSWGDLYVFCATLLWAIEIIIAKRLLSTINPNVVVWARMFLGALAIGIFLVATHQLSPLFNYSLIQWKWVAITGIFLVGYVWTFYHGLRYVRASVATAVLAIGAPITNLVTLIMQGNVTWGVNQWWGVICIVAGIGMIIGFKKVFENWKLMVEHSSRIFASLKRDR